MKSIEEYKEAISERYIQDFKEELSFFNKLMILPIADKMKDILKSDKKICVDNLDDLEDLGFWRKVLGIKILDYQLFGSLLDKTLKFLKDKQEKILQAETEGRLDELLKLVINGKLDILEKHVDGDEDEEKAKEKDEEKMKEKDEEKTKEKDEEKTKEKDEEKAKEKDEEKTKEKDEEKAKEKDEEKAKEKDEEKGKEKDEEKGKEKDEEKTKEKDEEKSKEDKLKNNNHKVERRGNKMFKIIGITSLEKLPKGYKRKDPQNYDEKNQETYPINYHINIGDSEYVFFSNGRCLYGGEMMNTKDVIEYLNSPYTLSHEDFLTYFEGENFYQRNAGDCWLLATIDSLVSFGDYEKLIRSSISKNKNGFRIRLPLGSIKGDKKGKDYFVSFDELQKKQLGIHGNNFVLVEGKQGIQALVRAYLRHTSRDGNNESDVDFLNLEGGEGLYAFNSLVSFPGMKTYDGQRTISKEEEKIDTEGTMDKQFVNQFCSVLESFNPKNDMLTLGVCQKHETNNDRKNHSTDYYDKLGHYSEANHEISVEAVKINGGNLIITVSNPWNSQRTYDILFNDLLKSCKTFSLCTKKERTGLKKFNHSYGEGSRKHAASDNMKNIDDARSVNQIVEFTGEENEELRKARGDIIVENISKNKIKVSSYNFMTEVEQKKGEIIIGTGESKLSIPEAEISNTFNGKQNNVYRLYLYGAKIANMIHFIKNKYSTSNDELLLDDDGILKLDNLWPIPNVDIIKDRSQLGIRRNKTKKEIVKYLQVLGYKCEIRL